jgi:hypothetical protein
MDGSGVSSKSPIQGSTLLVLRPLSQLEDQNNFFKKGLFYGVILDIVGPLLETIDGNKYVFVAIDHYSKWCEARLIKEHDVSYC